MSDKGEGNWRLPRHLAKGEKRHEDGEDEWWKGTVQQGKRGREGRTRRQNHCFNTRFPSISHGDKKLRIIKTNLTTKTRHTTVRR